jgi:hypothetical protein
MILTNDKDEIPSEMWTGGAYLVLEVVEASAGNIARPNWTVA